MERGYGFPSSFGTPQGSSFSPCRGKTFQAARSGENQPLFVLLRELFFVFVGDFPSSLRGA